MYCLDTDIIIEILRGNEDIRPFMRRLDKINIPIISLLELYKGAFLSNNKEHAISLIMKIIGQSEILQLDIDTCRVFGEIYAYLHNKGRLTQENDLMIAAICITNNATLITRNKKHYENIPGLKAEYI